MSCQPITARWYATEVPMTPPPTTTTRAWVGMLAGFELAALTGSGCPGQNAILASSYGGAQGSRLALLRPAWTQAWVYIVRYTRQRCAKHHTIERSEERRVGKECRCWWWQ